MRAARTSYMEDMTWSAATWQGTPIADRVSPGRPAGGSAGRMLERDARLENGCANSCSCGIASQDIRRWRSRSICEAAAKACTRIHAIRMRNISRRYSVWDLLMIRLENGDVFYRSISRDRQRRLFQNKSASPCKNIATIPELPSFAGRCAGAAGASGPYWSRRPDGRVFCSVCCPASTPSVGLPAEGLRIHWRSKCSDPSLLRRRLIR